MPLKLIDKITQIPQRYILQLNVLARKALIQSNAFRRSRFPIVENIPLSILPELSLSEDHERGLWHPGALEEIESVFDLLYQSKKKISYLMYPMEYCGTTEKVLAGARKHYRNTSDLFLFQFNESDVGVHFSGVHAQKRNKICRKIDQGVKELIELFRSAWEQLDIFLIGDHGMSDIKLSLNIEKVIKRTARKSRLRLLRDYLYFLDSTMMRIWFLNQKAEKVFQSMYDIPALDQYGLWITAEKARQYRIPEPGGKYGDMIWWANQGVVIAPCFFHPGKHPVKAMHGYLSDYDDMKGFALCYREGDHTHKHIEECTLYDVCPTLCDIVGVNYPNRNEGRSLLAG